MVQSQRSDASVIAFAPYSGLLAHARLEFSVFEQVASTGAHVDLLRCRGALPTPCTTMDGTLGVDGIPGRQAAAATCRFCIEAGGILSSVAGVHEVFIEDLIDEQVRTDCHNLAAEVTPLDWQNLVVDGIAVGKHAAYVSLIRAKATSPSDLHHVWDRYVVDLEASILTLRATQSLLSRSHYDVAVTFGGLYGPERVFHRVTCSAAVPLVVLEGSILNQERHSVVHAFTTDAKYAHPVFDPEWTAYRDVPLDRLTAERIRVHHEGLLDSANPLVYSSDRNKELNSSAVRERFDIPENAPVLLVLISSPDEEVSREFTAGQDPALGQDSVALQARAVERIVSFAERNPNVHVVIRLHPRLYGDHRTSAASPALAYYSSLAVNAPANVHINSPDQNLSLYDIAMITDAGVVHQSTAGLELLALGLPVVASGPWLIAYPLDLVSVAPDSEGVDFDQVLLAALDSAPDLSRTRGAYRWWGFISNFNRMPTVSEAADSREAPSPDAHPESKITSPAAHLKSTARRLTPTPLRQRMALNIRRRKLSQLARDVSSPQLQPSNEETIGSSTFWSVASGVNVVRGQAPMSVAEETQFLTQQVDRLAVLLNIDDRSRGKLGRFVRATRLESREIS